MRQKVREKIISALYAIDILNEINISNNDNCYGPIDDIGNYLLNKYDDKDYFYKVVQEVLKNKIELDKIISKHMVNTWSIIQLGNIEKQILRVALYEYIYEKIPLKIIISNSLKLSDKYLSEKYSKFIHGILSSYFNDNKCK